MPASYRQLHLLKAASSCSHAALLLTALYASFAYPSLNETSVDLVPAANYILISRLEGSQEHIAIFLNSSSLALPFS